MTGTQKRKVLKLHWIPDQVRNDKTAAYAFGSIATQSWRRNPLLFRDITFWMPDQRVRHDGADMDQNYGSYAT